VIGAVVDVHFLDDTPEVYTAVTVKNGDKTAVLEVASHLGGNTVRCVAMESTDGLRRGDEVTSTGAPMQAPVGINVLGRIWNVLGEVIDNEPIDRSTLGSASIHRAAPTFN